MSAWRRIPPSAPRREIARSVQTADPIVDLNVAPEAALRDLPGIGPALARRIVAGRPYGAVEDLRRVRGIGPRTLLRLRPRVTVRR
ncbi:MAG: helix-hairpin-helix domain-containing protein [Polyangiales bacterium]